MDNVEYLLSTYIGEEQTYYLIKWYEHHPDYTLEVLGADESKADHSAYLTPYVAQAQLNLAEEAGDDIDIGPAFVAAITGLGRNDPDGSVEPDDRQGEAADSYAMSVRPAFKGSRAHWELHGSQFPEYASEAEYIQGAVDVTFNPQSESVFRPSDGATLYRVGKKFVVVDSTNNITTFFKPDNISTYWAGELAGIRQWYINNGLIPPL